MKAIRSHKLTLLLVLFSSILVHAFPRTYVSVNGNDGNTSMGCPVTAPCRSFGAAQGVTDPFGEIVAVDTGDYAPVTITQSVTIQAAPGVDATVFSFFFTDAIRVTAGTYDTVILRGLNVNGVNSGSSGIRFISGGTLNIENCNITSFMNNGISVEAGGTVYIKDSEVENSMTAIRLQSPSALIHASIDGVHLQHNMYVGLFAGENSQSTLRKSVLADNSYGGVLAGDWVGTTEVNVEDCLIQGSNIGILSSSGGGGGTAVVRVSHSSIVDNSTGLTAFGAPLLSYGNNRLAGNGMDGSFTGLIGLQ